MIRSWFHFRWAAFGLVYMHEEQPGVCINCIFYAMILFCLAIEKCSRLVKFHGASFLFSLGASRKKAMKNGHDSRSWNELCRTLSEQNFWITSSWAVTEAKFLFFWHFYDMPSCLAFRSTVQQSSSLLKMCILVSLWNSFYRPSIGWLLLYRIWGILDDPLGVLRIFPPH